jgi:hypothetical protein
MATKLFFEMLDEVNADVSTLKTKYAGSGALRILFEHAFKPEKKFLLPETDPPYKADIHPIGMAPTTLLHESKRLYVFTRADLTKLKREGLFIDLLESIDKNDAKVLLAVKNQELPKLFPKITEKVVTDAGFL